jgi:hypothetical protein
MTVPTNAGFAEMAKHCTGTGSPVAFTYIAVGTGTGQGATSTTLAAEITDSGLERVVADTVSTVTTTQTDDTANWQEVFTATGTKIVAEAGIFNAASAGDMLIVGDLSTVASMVSGDTLTLTMKCQFKAAA